MSIVKILNAINKIHSDVNIRLDAIENELAIIRCKCENIDTIIQKGKHNVGNGEAINKSNHSILYLHLKI